MPTLKSEDTETIGVATIAADFNGVDDRAWFVYVIECSDDSLYTGISTDVARRYTQHVHGKGARYTRAHPPLRLLAQFAVTSRSLALKAEWAIKRLSADAKRRLCADIVSGGVDAVHAQLLPASSTTRADATAKPRVTPKRGATKHPQKLQRTPSAVRE